MFSCAKKNARRKIARSGRQAANNVRLIRFCETGEPGVKQSEPGVKQREAE